MKDIPFLVPNLQQHDIDEVVAVLQSGMLTQGGKVEELENNISKYLGVKNAIAVSSGTAALHLALIACGIGKGDEVLVPAFSFVATANVVELVGAKPIFVDIDLKTFNIDKSLIEKEITPATKAIIPVHEFGLACDIQEICVLAEKYKIIVIEDAACALGATKNNAFTGTFGTVGCFSFHPRKVITSGEGGMLVTNHDYLARKFKIQRNQGIEFQNAKIEFVDVGFNYRMTDFQAALVCNQFKRLDKIIENKTILAEIYQKEIINPSISIPYAPEKAKHTWQTFHLLTKCLKQRDKLSEYLKENGVLTNYGAQCIPAMKYYLRKYHYNPLKSFPNAHRAYTCGLAIPLYERLNTQQIKYIASTINKYHLEQEL